MKTAEDGIEATQPSESADLVRGEYCFQVREKWDLSDVCVGLSILPRG